MKTVENTQESQKLVNIHDIIRDIEKQINNSENEDCYDAVDRASKYGKIDAYRNIKDIIKTKYLS